MVKVVMLIIGYVYVCSGWCGCDLPMNVVCVCGSWVFDSRGDGLDAHVEDALDGAMQADDIYEWERSCLSTV